MPDSVRPTKARFTWTFCVLTTLAFAVVAARLVQLQVIEYEDRAEEVAHQLYGTVREPDRRGTITDRRGIVLATSIPVKGCALDPKLFFESPNPDPEGLIERLDKVLQLSNSERDKIRSGLARRRTKTDKDGNEHVEPLRFVWVRMHLTDEQYVDLTAKIQSAKKTAALAMKNRSRWLTQKAKNAKDPEKSAFCQKAADGWEQEANLAKSLYAGLLFPPEFERVYPQGNLAAHVLGFTSIDGVGQEGVERSLNSLLKGTPLDRVVARDARSRMLSTLVTDTRSTEGMTVELTIDSVIQSIVQEELQQSIDKLKKEFADITAQAVVMDPWTGDILAMANYPSFDPNDPAAVDPRNRLNDAIASVQEPGSTFKPLVLSGSIEEKLADFSETIDCATFRMENGRTIKDLHPYGKMTLERALIKSSNPAMVRVGLRLGPQKMREYVRKYGFGERTLDLDMNGKTTNLLTTEVRGRVTKAEKWNLYTMGSVPMGYEINVTTLQMACAYSAIANGGMLPKPNIVRSIYRPNGELTLKVEPEMRWRVISEDTAAKIRKVLRGVITEGTGRRANIEEYELGGKTGSASMMAKPEELPPGSKPQYSKNRNTANFICLAPWDKPRVVVCVSVRETSKYGGEASAPVGGNIAKRVLAYLGQPTKNGDRVSGEILPLEGYDPPQVPVEYSRGASDDDNAMQDDIDPRWIEDWVEDPDAAG